MCASDPRYEVFLRFPEDADEQEEDGSSFLMKHHSFYEIVLPSKIFEGFASVVVLAAHFEDSQMYHLLKESPGVRLVDIKRVLGGPQIKARFAALVDRYSSVTILPLTPQQKALSKYQLRDQLLAPDRHVDSILEEVGSATGLRKSLRLRAMNSAYKFPPGHKRALKYLRGRGDIVFDVMGWYIQSASKAIQSIMKDEEIHGLPLIVLNNMYAKNEKYLAMLRDEKDRPCMELLTLMNHGLNSYSDRNVIAFVAAVNPHPDMIQFYKERLPKYDFEKDHVADVCVQSVCRLSLRDPKSSEKVLVVVPDLAIASLLEEKMFERANVAKEFSVKLGSKVTLNNDLENRYGKEYADRNRAQKRSSKARQRRASSPIQTRLTSINNLLSRHRRKASEGNKEAADRVVALEYERELIQQLRAKYTNMEDQKLLDKVGLLIKR